MRLPFLLPLSLAIGVVQGCEKPAPRHAAPSFTHLAQDGDFAAYWYQGLAELSSYDLKINRYGEPRQGDAVLIFVTEPFSRSRQVKLDNPTEAGDDKATVMKLNAVWKFPTGIYDYSLMNSLFTPVDLQALPHTLKQTCSIQDWCGQAFFQLNREKNHYLLRQYSYFEKEGDHSTKVEPDLLEDELFTRIRINPASLPSGEVDLLPGGFYARLSHLPLKPKRARIQFEESEATTQCVVEYLHLDRTLRINYETTFPYRILSWTEEEAQRVVVSGKLRKTLQTAYWNKNAGEFLPLRDTLELLY